MWTSHGAGRQPSNVTASVSHTLRSADIKKEVFSIRAERVCRAFAAQTVVASHRRTRFALKRFADGSQLTLLGMLLH